MAFDALDLSLALVPQLRPAHARLVAHDPDLARQLRRAAHSIALNLTEGRERRGKDRAHLYRVAAGSAAETDAVLRLALGWGWIAPAEVADALATLDRVRAMLYRLTR